MQAQLRVSRWPLHNAHFLLHILGDFNDMWMFNLTSGWWTWLGGDQITNQRGIYGTLGVAARTNRPGARDGQSMVIHPSGESIYVFGGFGYDITTYRGGKSIFVF